MYAIACADMGFKACPYVAKGETVEAAADDLKTHGMSAHATEVGEMMERMSAEEMMKKMTAAAKQS